MICPKCGHERSAKDDPLIPDYQCPACGIVYAKFGKTYVPPPKPKSDPVTKKLIASVIKLLKKSHGALQQAADNQRQRASLRMQDTDKKRSSSAQLVISLIVFITLYSLLNNDHKTVSTQATNELQQREAQSAQIIARNKESERQRKLAERDARQRQQELERQQREAACQSDMNCSAKKAFVGDASVNCQRSVERMAKYRFKWTDSWLQSKFNSVIWKDSARTVLHASGGYLELENGFGAWQPYRYICEVRIADNQVLDIQMAPGRM